MLKKTSAVKSKKTSITKKKPVVKTKTTTVKKKVVKKAPIKKTSKPLVKKANQIVVDIISDDNGAKELMPDFSSWSDFKKEENYNREENNDLVEDNYEEATEEISNEEEVAHDYDDSDDYDKQKKFFSDWAQQITPQNSEEKPIVTPKKSVGLYRRQAFFYLGATLILLLAVAYFFLVKLTVVIYPQGEEVKDYISFNVSGQNSVASSTEPSTVNQSIDGELKVIEVEAEKTYQISAEEVVGESSGSEVTGKVTLINNYTKAQPLVATTRLLSSDGKLFRLKEAVNIPAGGTLVADVYADKPSPEMEIETPTKFTIPGLWAGLQKDIYAESSEPLIYQAKVKRIVKQSDLDRAKKDISEVLDLKATNDLKAITTDKIAVSKSLNDELSAEFNVKLGEEKSEFTVKAKKKIIAAVFSKDKVAEIAKTKMAMIISDDKQLSDFNNNQITYDFEEYNSDNNVASIRASFMGTVSLKSDSSLIDPKKLSGLNEEQIATYLKSFPEIKDYKLEFWPTFIKTAPNLPDRITLKIAE